MLPEKLQDVRWFRLARGCSTLRHLTTHQLYSGRGIDSSNDGVAMKSFDDSAVLRGMEFERFWLDVIGLHVPHPDMDRDQVRNRLREIMQFARIAVCLADCG